MMRNYIISLIPKRSMNLEEKTKTLKQRERLGYNARRNEAYLQDEVYLQTENRRAEQKKYERLTDEQKHDADLMMIAAIIAAIS